MQSDPPVVPGPADPPSLDEAPVDPPVDSLDGPPVDPPDEEFAPEEPSLWVTAPLVDGCTALVLTSGSATKVDPASVSEPGESALQPTASVPRAHSCAFHDLPPHEKCQRLR